jgi:hypothetical protein
MVRRMAIVVVMMAMVMTVMKVMLVARISWPQFEALIPQRRYNLH